MSPTVLSVQNQIIYTKSAQGSTVHARGIKLNHVARAIAKGNKVEGEKGRMIATFRGLEVVYIAHPDGRIIVLKFSKVEAVA